MGKLVQLVLLIALLQRDKGRVHGVIVLWSRLFLASLDNIWRGAGAAGLITAKTAGIVRGKDVDLE